MRPISHFTRIDKVIPGGYSTRVSRSKILAKTRVCFLIQIMNNRILITQAGLDQNKAELESLVNTRRPQLVERLSLARSMGDLSENSDYQSAREELSFMDNRIEDLEVLVKNAQVMVPASFDKVDFGHQVTVKIDSTQAVFSIVGEPEANPAQKRISHSSPLGLALMGKKVGDKVEVIAPVGKLVYTIVSIK